MPSWQEVAASLLEPDVAASLLGAEWAGAQPGPAPAPPRRRYSHLPPDIAAGLERLQRTPTARFRGDTAAWTRAVDDAHALAVDGWAGKALALGWNVYDVFGIGKRESLDFAGLAVWLEGREVVAMDADRAIVRAHGSRAYFERGGWGHGRDASADPVLLWQFGR